MSNKYLLALLLAASVSAPTTQAQTQINGCQGEGCDCVAAYRDAVNTGKPTNFAIPLFRPMTLYARPDVRSPVLGRYKPRAKAVPLRHFILVLKPGLYVVEALHTPVEGLRKGDRLHTLLNEGEGHVSATKVGTKKQVHFSGAEDVSLETLRETVAEDWIEVSVGKLRGFTNDYPFEGCLE